MTREPPGTGTEKPPIIDLAAASGERSTWDRPLWVVLAWSVAELVFVTNPWQISSALRVRVLRALGARIGRGVIFRPRTRVKFPWKLEIGDRSWIGDGVWFHNQADIRLGTDVMISQETFFTTVSHRHRIDMGLITRQITIDDGVWITSRCMLLGGTSIGRSFLAQPMSLFGGVIPPNVIVAGNPARTIGPRFEPPSQSATLSMRGR